MGLLDEAKRYLKREVSVAFDIGDDITSLTTGSFAADIATGIGGFPLGRLTEVFGWEGSAKSTLCLSACAAAERAGRFWTYVDPERGIDRTWAAHIGCTLDDESKGLYLTPDTFEETIRIVDRLAETGEVPLVVVDSVPAMVPKSEMEGRIDEIGAIGARARLLASVLPKITKTIQHKKVALVMVNQMRQKVNTGFQPSFMQSREQQEQSSGGSALKFYSSLRLDMRIVKKGLVKEKQVDFFTAKEGDVATANLHEVHVFKNKVAAPYRKAQFIVRYDEKRGLFGIDNIRSIMDIARSQGIVVEKRGGHFAYQNAAGVNFTVHGEDALYDHLLGTPESFQAVQTDVLALPVVDKVLRRQEPLP